MPYTCQIVILDILRYSHGDSVDCFAFFLRYLKTKLSLSHGGNIWGL